MGAEDKLLTVEQAAEQLQMHPATVRRFIRQGTIAGSRIGARQWRIRSSDLDLFINAGRAGENPRGE